MNSTTKIRFDAIEPAQRALESLPAFKSEKISKAHAVQLLTPQIRAAQAKGYSMEAIAKILVEQNVSIPISSLRAYLSEGAATARGKKKPRKGKSSEESNPATRPTAAKEPAESATTTAPAPTGPSVKPASPVAAPSVDNNWDLTPRAEKKGPPVPHGFYVRPDTKNI